MYEIHQHNRTCKKMPLKVQFYPLAIPKDATLLGQAVVGSSSGPGQGLLVNSWMGDLPDKSGEKASYGNNLIGSSFIQPALAAHLSSSVLPGKYSSVVTEFGCIPVITNYQTKEYGWVMMR